MAASESGFSSPHFTNHSTLSSHESLFWPLTTRGHGHHRLSDQYQSITQGLEQSWKDKCYKLQINLLFAFPKTPASPLRPQTSNQIKEFFRWAERVSLLTFSSGKKTNTCHANRSSRLVSPNIWASSLLTAVVLQTLKGQRFKMNSPHHLPRPRIF